MPASARFKVYIIDEAHQITSDAFNALLKLVEEPPPHLKFVFATTEPEKVLQTIRSRTHHYAVPPRPAGAPARVPRQGLRRRGRRGRAGRAAARRARRSRVGARQPLGARPAAGRRRARRSHRRARRRAARAVRRRRCSMTRWKRWLPKAAAGAFSVVEQVMATGHDPRRFAMDLLERVRDLLMLQTVPDAPDRGLLAEYAPDQIERMRSQAGRMGASELSRAADLMHDGLVEMRDTISPRLMLELVLARVLLPGASADPDGAAGAPGAAGASARPHRCAEAAPAAPRAPRSHPAVPRRRPLRHSPREPARPGRARPPRKAGPRADSLAGAGRPGPAPRAAPAEPAQPRPRRAPPAATPQAPGCRRRDPRERRPRWPDLLDRDRRRTRPRISHGRRAARSGAARGGPRQPSWCSHSRRPTRRNFQEAGHRRDACYATALSRPLRGQLEGQGRPQVAGQPCPRRRPTLAFPTARSACPG